MLVLVVANPRFEPANLNRKEGGKERLALNKNHEGWAQAVLAMRGHGTTAHSAKRPFAREQQHHVFSGQNHRYQSWWC